MMLPPGGVAEVAVMAAVAGMATGTGPTRRRWR